MKTENPKHKVEIIKTLTLKVISQVSKGFRPGFLGDTLCIYPLGSSSVIYI
jgi:hypothetical protein